MYIERDAVKFWRQLSQHAQVSFEAIAISYNAAFKTKNVLVSKVCELYTEMDNDDLDIEEPGTNDSETYLRKTST